MSTTTQIVAEENFLFSLSAKIQTYIRSNAEKF